MPARNAAHSRASTTSSFNLRGDAECRLPPAFPVLWTTDHPGGLQPSVSTVHVTVADASGMTTWQEQPDLIHSDGVTDRHFVVETDELLRTLVRFGDGTNGIALPDDATVTCSWLSGYGPTATSARILCSTSTPPALPNIALAPSRGIHST